MNIPIKKDREAQCGGTAATNRRWSAVVQERAQVARFQQMAELAEGGLVRHRLAAQIDTSEIP